MRTKRAALGTQRRIIHSLALAAAPPARHRRTYSINNVNEMIDIGRSSLADMSLSSTCLLWRLEWGGLVLASGSLTMVRGVRRYSSVRVCGGGGGGRWVWWRWWHRHRHWGMDVVHSAFSVVRVRRKIVDELGESNFIRIHGINNLVWSGLVLWKLMWKLLKKLSHSAIYL